MAKSQGNRKSGAVSLNNLSGEIANLLVEYTSDVTAGLEKAKNKSANDGVKALKTNSRVLTGDYARNWAKKKVNTAVVVHNKDEYRLTHLLEKGHLNRDGKTRSNKFVHIAPVEEKMIADFEKYMERVIKGESI